LTLCEIAVIGISQDTEKRFNIISATGPQVLSLPVTVDDLSSLPFPALNGCHNIYMSDPCMKSRILMINTVETG